MFVKAQNGKRFINLANVTDVYSERKTEGGKQKYVLYFDKIPAGSFNKQESIDRVLILLENRVQEKLKLLMANHQRLSIIRIRCSRSQMRMIWHEKTIICKR